MPMAASVKHVHVPDTCDRIAIFRQISQPQGVWFNVGILGRPAHEGQPHVYYGCLQFPPVPQSYQPLKRQ